MLMTIGRCYQPWLEMQIQYDKTIGCCCYYHGERGAWDFEQNPHLDLEAYWNGPHMQRVRQTIQRNDARGSGCSGCQFADYGIPEISATPSSFLTDRQSENYRRAIDHFQKKSLHVDSFPVRYYFNFGLSCNLQCVMCSQAEIRQKNTQSLPAEIFEDLEDYFQYAEQIAIIGGEPFVIPEAREFIKKINNSPSLANIRITIFTNGTLLDKFLNHFQNIPRINFCISLDSVGETYEHIRQGANWQKTASNIQQIVALGKRHNHDWTVTIASVLMKSSLVNLVPYVQWCIANDLSCNFVPVVSNMLNKKEDIFSYPQLLQDIPRWEQILDDAITIMARAESFSRTAERLETMKKRLSKTFSAYLKNPQLFSSPKLTDINKMLAKIGSDHFMIWGTGSYYDINFSPTIKSYNGKNFLGFIDTNPTKWGQVFEDKTVYSPEHIKEIKPQTILIASAMRREIIEQIKRIGLENCDVY